jgi:hypothetical protein
VTLRHTPEEKNPLKITCLSRLNYGHRKPLQAECHRLSLLINIIYGFKFLSEARVLETMVIVIVQAAGRNNKERNVTA